MRSKETDALDRLYAAPLAEFTPLRRALAAELRAKEPAAARRLEHASKPTRTAWALDQVARREPRLLEALVAAHAAAAEAQRRGDPAAVLRTSREYREAVAAAVRAAREVLADAGFAATTAQARRMAETLHAAAALPGEARRQLLAGRLVRDVTLEDRLAELGAGPPRGKSHRTANANAERRKTQAERRATAQRAAELRATREREAARRAARERLAAMEAEASAARAEARRAEVAATRAREAAERARRRATELEARLRRQKERLGSSRSVSGPRRDVAARALRREGTS